MLTRREFASLERYIAGNYGEDQFPEPGELKISAHELYRLENVFFPSVYTYDPADDGPECEIITRILASHPEGYND